MNELEAKIAEALEWKQQYDEVESKRTRDCLRDKMYDLLENYLESQIIKLLGMEATSRQKNIKVDDEIKIDEISFCYKGEKILVTPKSPRVEINSLVFDEPLNLFFGNHGVNEKLLLATLAQIDTKTSPLRINAIIKLSLTVNAASEESAWRQAKNNIQQHLSSSSFQITKICQQSS